MGFDGYISKNYLLEKNQEYLSETITLTREPDNLDHGYKDDIPLGVKVGTGMVLAALTIALLGKGIKELCRYIHERRERKRWVSEETMKYYREIIWGRKENVEMLEERKWN